MTKKGITPVVAIVLLLLLTIAAAGAAFAFSQNLIGQKIAEGEERAASSLNIKDITCSNDPNTVNVTIDASNDGDINLDSGDGFIYWVSNGSLLTQNTDSNDPGNTLQWDADTFETNFFNGTKSVSSGTQYKVEIVFDTGFTASAQCEG